jgi:YD repeat-containing protein
MMSSGSPYLGLRSFQPDQADIFFGREEQTDELLKKLGQTRFLSIVGPSGCGKSSLVMAGMISALETGFMVDAGSRWRIAMMRPGSHPLRRLTQALSNDSALGLELTGNHAVPLLEATLRRGPRGLLEALNENRLPPETNLLVLVDQFEELFRLRTQVNQNEHDAFVSLLLATVQQRELPIYVAITMRSEYLGDCAIFPGLPEALNQSQYITPRMNRDQRKAAIIGPARVFGGDVELPLVNRLLNETELDPNQLPVLQHLLTRMWASTSPERVIPRTSTFFVENPAETVGHVLTMVDYEAVGGIAGALSIHADRAFESLNDEQKRIAEIIFRSLCERGSAKRDGRHPTAIGEIAGRAGISSEQVIKVAEVFRDPAYGFITPAPPEQLFDDTVIDITHESLILLWKRLSVWVDDEAKSAETYRFLEETAHRWREGKAALWGTPNLEIALSWKERERPSLFIAKRYGGDFEGAMSFLHASEEEQRKQRQREERNQRQRLRRAVTLAVVLASAVLILCAGILGYFYAWVWPNVRYYNTFFKVDGEPVGVGQLSENWIGHRPVSLRITKKGILGHVERMEAIDSRKELTVHHSIGTYLEAEESAPREAIWQYSYDASGRVSYEMAFDPSEKPVWGFVYLPPRPGGSKTLTGYFIDSNGNPRPDRTYSGSIVETETRRIPTGFEEHRRYLNRGGQAIRGPDKAFGQIIRYDTRGRWLETISLDPQGNPMNDEVGNAIIRCRKSDLMGNTLEAEALDASGHITLLTEGWSIVRRQFDTYGNETDRRYYDDSGAPALHVKGYHQVKLKLDVRGNVIEESYWDLAGGPAVCDEGFHTTRLEYDEYNNVVTESFFDHSGSPASNKRGYSIWVGQYDNLKNLIGEQYYDAHRQPVLSSDGSARHRYVYNAFGKVIEVTYLGVDGAPVLNKEGYSGYTCEYDDQGHHIATTYFGTDTKPLLVKGGYARWYQSYDSLGNITKTSYFGVDGKPLLSADGYAEDSLKYDASGNEIEVAYFGARGEPILTKEGIAGWHSDYDSAGNETRRVYTGLKDEPIFSSDGVVGFTSRYDNLGRRMEMKYFGLAGQAVTHRDGYAEWTAVYDSRGNEKETRYLDINGSPALRNWEDENDSNVPGYSSVKKEFNSQGKTVEEAYFGVNGEPVVRPQGWARAIHTYDTRGNQVESSYFGAYGEPVVTNLGYHSVKRSYDDRGNLIDLRYYHVDGRPVATSEGYAHLIKRYDAYGRLIEQLLFDAKDQPTELVSEGFQKEVRSYDSRGNKSEDAYFNATGPVLHRDGYHLIRYRYDNRGNETERAYRGIHGELVENKAEGYSILRSGYDERNNLVELDFFDVNGRPTLCKDGFARTKITYDARGQKAGQWWYDKGGALGDNRSGYAGMRSEYNTQGQVSVETYFDSQGKPVLLPKQSDDNDWGYASRRVSYDGWGNIVDERYFGTHGEPIMNGIGVHRIVQKYNARRQQVEIATFDVDGNAALNEYGYARLLREYDDRGHLTTVCAFGEHGQLTEATYGYARMTSRYDAKGNLIEEAYFGDDGELKVLSDYGCARVVFAYDAEGNRVRESYYGSDNALTDDYRGYARVDKKYDARRHVTEERYFAANGLPVRLGDGRGQHMTRYTYDSFGNVAEERYFGVHDEPVRGFSPDGELCGYWTAMYDKAKNRIATIHHQEFPTMH